MSKVTYEDAMSELAVMFPGLTPELLDTVLRQNMGQLERTVEQLLEITDGSVEPASPLPNNYGAKHNSGRAWRHELPPDYLCVPPALMRILNEQIAQDAELAAAIQNELDNEDEVNADGVRVHSEGGGVLSAIGKLGKNMKEKIKNRVNRMRGERYQSLTAADEETMIHTK